jgi:hypothetical protein
MTRLVVHERWGTAGVGGFWPTLCGLSPVARRTTSDWAENVNCEACILRRLRLEQQGLLEAQPRRGSGG